MTVSSRCGRRGGRTCVTAMMLTMANEADVNMPGTLHHLVTQQMPDGGWNCRKDATHASFHTTLSTLEALAPLEGHDSQARGAGDRGQEFLLAHHLYRSHRTGRVVRDTFTRFSFPVLLVLRRTPRVGLLAWLHPRPTAG